VVYAFFEVAYLQNQINQLQTNNAELADLQSQILQLQNENSQLAANNTTLNEELQQYRSGNNGTSNGNNNPSSNSNSESLQLTVASVDKSDTAFNITMQLYNAGNTVATIEVIFLNGQALSYYENNMNIVYGFESSAIVPGATVTGSMYLPMGTSWRSGMNIDVSIQTISGNHYSKTITLP
jgi:hypothetical protein